MSRWTERNKVILNCIYHHLSVEGQVCLLYLRMFEQNVKFLHYIYGHWLLNQKESLDDVSKKWPIAIERHNYAQKFIILRNAGGRA